MSTNVEVTCKDDTYTISVIVSGLRKNEDDYQDEVLLTYYLGNDFNDLTYALNVWLTNGRFVLKDYFSFEDWNAFGTSYFVSINQQPLNSMNHVCTMSPSGSVSTGWGSVSRNVELEVKCVYK